MHFGEEKVVLTEKIVIDAELAETHSFEEKVASRLTILKSRLQRVSAQDLYRSHADTGLETFIVGGS